MSRSAHSFSWQADLEAARAGSKEALDRLLGDARPYLLKAANRLVPDDLKARFDEEDVVQCTLLETFLSFSSFQGATSKEWLGWLLHILRHNVQDMARHDHRSKRSVAREIHADGSGTTLGLREDLAFTKKTPETILLRREERASVKLAIHELPDLRRQVVRLRFRFGLSCSEIAQRLGRSENAVQLLCQRALKSMSQRVDHHEAAILQ
jgi:RNA polymerase sigma-70 factor (subfamily 1)